MPTFTMLRAIFTIFKPLLKLHDAVSSLTKFLEFKPDHMFGCILDRKAGTPTFTTFQAILTPLEVQPCRNRTTEFPFRAVSRNLNLIINLDAYLINKRACKCLRHSKIFPPPLSPTLAKPHNEVSRLTNFSKLKFNHRFKSAFGK